MQRLKRILKVLKKLISEVLYEVYQREREDLFDKQLGNGAEEIKEYPEDPNDDYDED